MSLLGIASDYNIHFSLTSLSLIATFQEMYIIASFVIVYRKCGFEELSLTLFPRCKGVFLPQLAQYFRIKSTSWLKNIDKFDSAGFELVVFGYNLEYFG